MNKFKKLVAVLVSVVMACVFATGVFATDYVENLSAARAEVNGYLTSAGVYGMDGVVNSLNETQLRALRENARYSSIMLVFAKRLPPVNDEAPRPRPMSALLSAPLSARLAASSAMPASA